MVKAWQIRLLFDEGGVDSYSSSILHSTMGSQTRSVFAVGADISNSDAVHAVRVVQTRSDELVSGTDSYSKSSRQ